MNEEEKIKIFNQISNESINALDSAITDPENNGLNIFGVLMGMPDEDFEILRPLFQEEMIKAYNEPQAQM